MRNFSEKVAIIQAKVDALESQRKIIKKRLGYELSRRTVHPKLYLAELIAWPFVVLTTATLAYGIMMPDYDVLPPWYWPLVIGAFLFSVATVYALLISHIRYDAVSITEKTITGLENEQRNVAEGMAEFERQKEELYEYIKKFESLGPVIRNELGGKIKLHLQIDNFYAKIKLHRINLKQRFEFNDRDYIMVVDWVEKEQVRKILQEVSIRKNN